MPSQDSTNPKRSVVPVRQFNRPIDGKSRKTAGDEVSSKQSTESERSSEKMFVAFSEAGGREKSALFDLSDRNVPQSRDLPEKLKKCRENFKSQNL
jgi:hypothetical protein